jgi:hypothetical protein
MPGINLDVIQSLWVGDTLSTQEQMCIASYLIRGHRFHLYTYGPVAGVPHGTEIKEADEIVPKWKIDKFQNLANFSDLFRYMLLFKKGSWWTDLDSFCLKAFDFPQPYVFATQLSCNPGNPQDICGGVIKAPANSEIMSFCLSQVGAIDTTKNDWADLGPAMLMDAVPRFGLQKYARDKEAFCPLEHYDMPGNIFGDGTWNTKFSDETYAVHLWNEESRRAGVDKNGQHPNSLFSRLRAVGR